MVNACVFATFHYYIDSSILLLNVLLFSAVTLLMNFVVVRMIILQLQVVRVLCCHLESGIEILY